MAKVDERDGMSKQRDHCIRCGECCRSSSPTLQMEDVPLVLEGIIERRNLYTIRVGELVYDNVRDELRRAGREMIKVREKGGGQACIYYEEEERACAIYEHRPVQCAALTCWDVSRFMAVYKGPKASRKDLIRDGVLLGLIEEHEKRCSYSQLELWLKQIETGGAEAVERVLELLKFDYHLRPFTAKKMEIDPDEMDFLFGRPFVETIGMYGLEVTRQPDGSFLLTMAGSSSEEDQNRSA